MWRLLAEYSFPLLGVLRSSWQHCSSSVRRGKHKQPWGWTPTKHCKPNKCTEFTQRTAYTCRWLYFIKNLFYDIHDLSPPEWKQDVLNARFRCWVFHALSVKIPPSSDCEKTIKLASHNTITCNYASYLGFYVIAQFILRFVSLKKLCFMLVVQHME